MSSELSEMSGTKAQSDFSFAGFLLCMILQNISDVWFYGRNF